ncbi:MAG TPA: hypothetical protein DIT09_14845 [Glutamicibacter sp.]|nr:hypothetical protein [Glutamicibacter sp.]
MENLELLIRESAQNSWDAAIAGSIPKFGIEYRVLSHAQKELVARTIFSEGRQHTYLPSSLSKNELDVLEIWDRGTKGLDGPIRADLTVPKGRPTNFIDLVYKIGSSNKDQDAGGNYGFGKSSAFKASEAKAIVYWTVCFNEAGRLEHRLIASGVSKDFDLGGRSHVGRHWWGKRMYDSVTEESRLEPIVGPEAQELGEALFCRKFNIGETGTSILIVDPDELAMLGNFSDDESESELQIRNHEELLVSDVSKRITDVVLKHLWPKLVSNNSLRRMQIFVNGAEITESVAREYPFVGSYIACLDAVRNKHDSLNDSPSNTNVDVYPIIVGRKRELVGHVAFTQNIEISAPVRGADGGNHDTDIPKNSIALMRDGAELIVKYLSEIQEHPKELLYWTAVFKPCPEFDRDFAASEPSAHDDWVVGSLQGKSKSRVKVALQRVREQVSNFLGTNISTSVPSGTGSVSELALELGRLVANFGDTGQSKDLGEGQPSGGSGTSRSGGKRTGGGSSGSRTGTGRSLRVNEINFESTEAQRNIYSVDIQFLGDWSEERQFLVRPKVRIEGSARVAHEDDRFEFIWPEQVRELERSPKDGMVVVKETEDDSLTFEIESPGHLSFDLELEPRQQI